MKFNIRLFLTRNKVNATGKCPVRCRITYNKQRKEFSTGLFIYPKYWNRKKQKVLEDTEHSEYTNTQLSLIINKMNQVFLWLQVQERRFTAEDIYALFKGGKLKKEYNIVEYFEVFLEHLKRLVEIDIEQVTWNKFYYVKQHVKTFIKWKYQRMDYRLKDLKLQFLHDFEYYLKVEKKQAQITINKSIQRFRKPVKIAVAEGYLDRDPFILFKTKSAKKEVIFLSVDELKRLEGYTFSQSRLEMVKNMFIFCCYTGLAYAEMATLEDKHITIGFDGLKWISMERKKTGRVINIPLLPKALEILELYENEDLLLPVISNQRFNSYLKEIASIVGIEKRLTHHIARKTFASTVLLFNNVPMEIVSELLGHSNMSITQDYYGKVVMRKVGEEIRRLNEKLIP